MMRDDELLFISYQSFVINHFIVIQMPAYSIQVIGKVQGVFFRVSTQEKARALSIWGWVRNEPDSSVRIRAEGNTKALEKFVAWCHRGPAHAQVRQVIVDEITEEGFSDFLIHR
ncbi:acylphosphatase [Tunicatimonas pelagia]|uniref:acylphosphatase n=1 Tax=Tunicatimonas pelagia TaxID=931531 RepID=UPI0026654C1E|nr:acylphosphatase [Tunicatimonas pelagia]WKN46008.1 acylphosphatase [Tunicatimonas pelagia]